VRRTILRASATAGVALIGLAAGSQNLALNAGQSSSSKPSPASEWKTYGADLASTRYSPLDQIDSGNFATLKVAWKVSTESFLYSATPLFVRNMVYTTIGFNRTVVAIHPGTGDILWRHTEDEGVRGRNAARSGAGRGVAYWSNADGSDERIIYVTPGYRLLALNAKTGTTIPTFGIDGVVDLKRDDDQDLDLDTADLGLNATPLVAGDVVIVGAAQRFSGSPRTMHNARGYVRGFDVKTGKRLWIFHTVPKPGEYGYETWLDDSALRNGNTGAWAQFSADLDLGLVYIPVEMPTGDYYGGNRPGSTLFDESLVALDIKTGQRRWHFQATHHGIWDYDLPCAPVLFDAVVNGSRVKVLAQPTKQAFLFVLNRATGEPIWPIEERAVPQSTVPSERTSPTQPFPTKPVPFDRQGVSPEDLIDFTPALHAEALEVVKRYKIGPLFTPPSLSNVDGPIATIQVPADTGGANWPGASFDPDTNRLFIHSHTATYLAGVVPADPAISDMGYVAGQARAGRPGGGGGAAPAVDADVPAAPARGRGPGGLGVAAGGRDSTSVQGLPLIKPPYDRITAYDMTTGELVWQKPHSSTPDEIKNHPALQGLNLPRLGQPGRTFIGTLTTKTLLIAGEGGRHKNAAGQDIALLRAYDKATGADVGAVEMPEKQTGSPMTYMFNGKQYIAIAVSGASGAHLIAYTLQ
jgi:quinoprotein glucose dehydrogenase